MAKFLTYEDRVRSFLDKCIPEPNSGCWLWTGSVWNKKRGVQYGECVTFGKRELATRAAYREIGGKTVPLGLLIRHTCDTPLCVNPDHLLPGTQQDNADDMRARKRNAVGEQRPDSVLTDQQVREIRSSAETGVKLAAQYNVSPAMICSIKKRRRWRHLD
jgi:hypothetical protein